MKPIDARIRAGKFEFSLAAVMQHPDGTTFKIIPADNRPVTKLRRFLIVCCKYFFYQHPHANWTDWRDAWNAIKLEIPLLFDMVWAIDGTRQKATKSTAGYSKRKMQPIVDAIIALMDDQGLITPDPIAYDAWLQSAPPPGEEFPPLARLIDRYKQVRNDAL